MLFVILTTFLMPLYLASWKASDAGEGIHDRVPGAGNADDRRVLRARPRRLLHLLRRRPHPDVHHHRCVGRQAAVYASFKFFLYTLLGSVLMLLAIMAMYWEAGTTDIERCCADFPAEMQIWLWLAFFASFAVKMPMWPVHTWLPDAHVEAPTAGSVILAGILLKMGGYGFLRFSLPMFPLASEISRPWSSPVGDRDHLHLAGGADAGRHQEADRLFVGRPYGLCDHGHLHDQRAGHSGAHLPDDQSTASSPVRSSCASASSTTVCTPARSRPMAAWSTGCRFTRDLHGLHHGQCRSAGHIRLRR
jgi:hypothetical protein